MSSGTFCLCSVFRKLQLLQSLLEGTGDFVLQSAHRLISAVTRSKLLSKNTTTRKTRGCNKKESFNTTWLWKKKKEGATLKWVIYHLQHFVKGVCAVLRVASTVACPTSFELWWKSSRERNGFDWLLCTTPVQLMAPSPFNTLDTVPPVSCVWRGIRILKRHIYRQGR